MKNFLKQKNKQNRAFTLVEVLVAISIFTLSVLAMMAVLANGISDTNYAKQKMTAEYLAQEGIEYIRNMRDSYAISDITIPGPTWWDSFQINAHIQCSDGNGCYVADNSYGSSTSLLPSNTDKGQSLLYDQITGVYSYSGSGNNSGFTRKITVETINSDEIKVTVTVYWMQGSGEHSVTFTENLFNWIE